MLAKPHVCQKLGLQHALSDASAGYIAGCWLLIMPVDTLALLFIAYNLVAFGCQPLFSLLPEKLENTSIRTALLLAAVALLLAPGNHWLSLLCIATASALFHVSAGSISLKSADNDSLQLSWFIAPGVLGLLAGMAAGISGLSMVPWLLAASLLGSTFINTSAARPGKSTALPTEPLSISCCLAAVLFVLIAMRSLVWSFYQGNLTLSASILLTMAMAAFLGKLAGGWLDSTYSTRHWLLPTLILASGFLLLTEKTGSTITLASGLACLQSATPVMLKTLHQHLQKPALSAALGLGLAIALGGVSLSILMTIKPVSLNGFWLLPALLSVTYLMIFGYFKIQGR